MKAVLLAGGEATRLKTLTTVTNKHLLPIYDKPMILHPLQTLINAGLKDILVIIGERGGEEIIKLLGTGKEFGCKLSYEYQREALGIAHAIGLAEDFADGDDIAVVLGDNIFLEDIEIKAPPHIYLSHSDTPERFGVVKFYGEKVQKITEKPRKPDSNWIVTGLYIYPNNVFKVIKDLELSARGEYEVTDINNYYIKKRQLKYTMLDNEWVDAGTFESLFKAQHLIREKSLKNG